MADVLVHDLRPELVEGDGVGERLAARLDGELRVDVAEGEALPVHRADGTRPQVGVVPRELGNVAGVLSELILNIAEQRIIMKFACHSLLRWCCCGISQIFPESIP